MHLFHPLQDFMKSAIANFLLLVGEPMLNIAGEDGPNKWPYAALHEIDANRKLKNAK